MSLSQGSGSRSVARSGYDSVAVTDESILSSHLPQEYNLAIQATFRVDSDRFSRSIVDI